MIKLRTSERFKSIRKSKEQSEFIRPFDLVGWNRSRSPNGEQLQAAERHTKRRYQHVVFKDGGRSTILDFG